MEKYVIPEMEIVRFDAEDIIITSGEDPTEPTSLEYYVEPLE